LIVLHGSKIRAASSPQSVRCQGFSEELQHNVVITDLR